MKLAAAKKKYEFVRSSNGYKEETPEQVDTVKVRSQDAFGDVEKARDVVQAVGREYRRLTRECEVNRLNDAALDRYRGFTAKVEAILNEPTTQERFTFVNTQGLMTNVQNVLNTSHWAPLAAVSDAENALHALAARILVIRNEVGEAQIIDKLKKDIEAIKLQQARIRKEVEEWQRIDDEDKKAKTPALGEAGTISLVKGETKKLTHTIRWRQYPKDDVVVKVTASDPSITVPPDLNLNFERNPVPV